MAGSGQIGLHARPSPRDIGNHSLLDPRGAHLRRRVLELHDEILDRLEVPPEVDPGVLRPLASTSPIVWDGVTMASSYPFGRWQDVQPIVGIIFDPGPAMFLSF